MKNIPWAITMVLICCLLVNGCQRKPNYQELIILAGELVENGQLEKASELAHRALEDIRETYPSDNPKLIWPLNDVAALFTTLGQYAVAESLYLELLIMDEKHLGKEHINVARDLNNLGAAYRAMGQFDRAEPLFEQSAQICVKVLGPSHPDVLNPLFNLVELYETQQLPDKISSVYQRILTIYEQMLGPDNPDLAPILEDMAEFYRSVDDEEQAKTLEKRAGEIRAKQP